MGGLSFRVFRKEVREAIEDLTEYRIHSMMRFPAILIGRTKRRRRQEMGFSADGGAAAAFHI
jgi:hypothetical protein